MPTLPIYLAAVARQPSALVRYVGRLRWLVAFELVLWLLRPVGVRAQVLARRSGLWGDYYAGLNFERPVLHRLK